jgi:hypothetical protein
VSDRRKKIENLGRDRDDREKEKERGEGYIEIESARLDQIEEID